MPEIGTQVYWHNIPSSPPPWRNITEYRRTWALSQEIINNSHHHHNKDNKEKKEGKNVIISDPQAHLLETPLREIIAQRHRARTPARRQHRHWGVVLEPFLSPLHGLNMIMKELKVELITREEAAAAVQAVEEECNIMMMMSQQTQTQHKQYSTTSSYSSSSYFNNAGLSQSQSQGVKRKIKTETMTQQSTMAAMDMREAPLLEVVKLLCAKRGLEITTFTKAEMRRKRRISLADVLPRQRVIMAFDREKPFFIFVRAVVAKKRCDTTPRAQFLQIVAPTSNPVPWRRLAQGEIPNLPTKECVVVAVQRHDDFNNNNNNNNNKDEKKGEKVRSELLLGDDISDNDNNNNKMINDKEKKINTKNSRKRSRKDDNIKRLNKDDSDIDTTTTSSSSSEEGSLDLNEKEAEEEKIRLGPNPIFTAKDQIKDDPLFKTPIAVLRGVSRANNGVHDWIQRLVDTKARWQLYAINN